MNEPDSYIDGVLLRVKQSGLSNSEICRRAGIAWTTLARMKSGEQSPTIRTVDKIERVLDRHEAQS